MCPSGISAGGKERRERISGGAGSRPCYFALGRLWTAELAVSALLIIERVFKLSKDNYIHILYNLLIL